MALKDNSEHYGMVSRLLHWSMALVILWQFMSATSHYFFEDTAIEAFFWPSHKPLGMLLLVLMLLRLLWAFINRSNRPLSVSLFSKLGHISLYLLLIATPIVALIRQYGSGRTFEIFGVTIFTGFKSDKIQWMLDLGSDFHSELGWILLLLIVGHIVMSYLHKKDIMSRMWK